MATEDRRMGVVTPDDHGSLIGIAAWFLSVVVVLSIIMRLFIRFSTSHIPGKDDILAVVSMVSSSSFFAEPRTRRERCISPLDYGDARRREEDC